MTHATRRRVLRTLGAASVLGLVGVTHARDGPREISECTVIDEPGEYVLTRDIDAEGATGPCIEILADRVTLDGDGHAVDFDSYTDPLLLVTGSDVTVENVTATGGRYGVWFEGATRGLLRNCTVGYYSGIRLEETTETEIVENHIRVDNSDLTAINSYYNVIRDNFFEYADSGPALIDSDRNWVASNRIGSLSGVGIRRGSNNVVTRNEMYRAEWGGLGVFGDENFVSQNFVTDGGDDYSGMNVTGDRNRIIRNEIVSNRGEGIFLEDADRNHLIRNTVCNNRRGNIVIDPDSTGNRLVENETSC